MNEFELASIENQRIGRRANLAHELVDPRAAGVECIIDVCGGARSLDQQVHAGPGRR